LQVSDFHYDLPEELIAQEPPAERGASRMLVVSREKNSFYDDEFRNFSKYLRPGDCLVLNDTRVFPARLHGVRNETGAGIEVLLLRPVDEHENCWKALVKPGKRARRGDRIVFGPQLFAEILSQEEFGERTIRFVAELPLRDLLETLGETPLPPYIHRKPEPRDSERYQTIFAQRTGSAAAPTAGLHFTSRILDECRAAGAEIAYITLHVGLGTFAPVRGEQLSEIRLHSESFEIEEDDCERMRRAKRLVCAGTTTVRAIETALLRGGLSAQHGETDLFIYPGFRFQGVGAMLTNFHLPRSSLLMLVAAFAGRELALAAYEHAVRSRYRFFSYGDCMIIE
jgi:S-adenosylmethionine:tRNA ribosyltransferase-isomerase